MVLARALAAVRNELVQDQVLAARSAWGIVADDLPEEEAKTLGEALRSHGVECAVCRTAALPRLPAVERAKIIDGLPDGRPALIAVAAITESVTKTKSTASARLERTGGLSFNVRAERKPADMTDTEHRLDFYADLYYEDPARRMRIDASAFNFSGLGDRMQFRGQANLKLLLEDLLQAAPGTWTNQGARVLLEGKPIRSIGHRSLDDLEREARWLLTLRGMGRLDAPPAGIPPRRD